MDLTTLSREELLAEVTQAAVENRVPFSDRVPVTANGAAAEEEGVTAADLLTAGLIECCEPYTIPGLKRPVYVFPLGVDEYQNVVDWSTHIRREDPDTPIEGDLTRTRQQMRIFAAEMDVRVYQVIACCRQGPSRERKRCFGRQDFERVRKLVPYPAVLQICAISDRLAGTEEQLTPGAKLFFAASQAACENWLSASSAWDGCPPGLREMTERLKSLLSRAIWRGSLESGILSSLAEL